jgi:iron-sulfur cluster repair protein YtfE (RIC family)
MSAGPTQIMRAEHVQMRGLFSELRDACARRDEEALLGLTETLLMVMQQHNLKEEEVLYPMSDQALDSDAADLLARMRAMPE